MGDITVKKTGSAAATPLGYEKLTGLSTAKGFASIPTRARFAIVRTETNNVRFRDDGTAPTASEGLLLQTGEVLTYRGTLSAIKFIETTASATVFVLYYS